jgi:hypothetical protein
MIPSRSLVTFGKDRNVVNSSMIARSCRVRH